MFTRPQKWDQIIPVLFVVFCFGTTTTPSSLAFDCKYVTHLRTNNIQSLSCCNYLVPSAANIFFGRLWGHGLWWPCLMRQSNSSDTSESARKHDYLVGHVHTTAPGHTGCRPSYYLFSFFSSRTVSRCMDACCHVWPRLIEFSELVPTRELLDIFLPIFTELSSIKPRGPPTSLF